jgi:tripartite ATP-independent transporter DctM subunit
MRRNDGRAAAIGALLTRFDASWQRLEAWLCAVVIGAEVASLTLWVVLRALSDRARIGAASNVLNWLQTSSSLMLVGGLRGLATRLTLWLALLGASLATSRGKHVHVDVVVPHLPRRLRMPAVIAGWLVAAAICAAAAVGFVDYIGIADFHADANGRCAVDPSTTCDSPVRERLATVERAMADDFFLLGRQISLDARSLPRVLAGRPYDRWMTAAQWNAWLDGANWTAHFDKGAVDALRMDPADPGATRAPQVSSPGTGDTASGLLVRDLSLVFPFGLAALAFKFALRIALALSGQAPMGALDEAAAEVETAPTPGAVKVGMGAGGLAVLGIALGGGLLVALFFLLALLGTPLFVVMGGAAEVLWLVHPDAAYHHLRFVAPTVLDERFADNAVVVTIPLFTFVGYVLAEAKTPDRLVAAARTLLGWLPGGLAIVCILASAIFTVLTGGSGVTIIAVGGLLYPALRKQGYSESFSLGLVTTGGSVGLLLPSLPLGVYGIYAHVDLTELFKAVFVPGLFVVALLSGYAAWVAVREGVPREPLHLRPMAGALWDLRWELGILAVLAGTMGTGIAALDEAAGAVAFYVVVVQFFVLRDLDWKKDFVRLVTASMTLAGAVILILAMANALMNYVVDQHVPAKVLEFLIGMGIEHRWQFLIAMNASLLLLGMLMEGFSAVLVGIPLVLPFVADLGTRHVDEAMSPFQIAMIFLLNLEIAYCMPPLGLNLFLSSSRFNLPVSRLYRAVLPFVAVLAVGLVVVSYVPWFSTVAVTGDIAAARAKAETEHLPPRDAWMMECVQQDPTDPQPCSQADRAKYAAGADAPEAAGDDDARTDGVDAGGRTDLERGPHAAAP